MALQATDITDLVAATVNELGEGHATNLILTDRDYPMVRALFGMKSEAMKKGKVEFQGGPLIQWDVVVRDGGQAKQTGLYQQDNPNVVNGIVQAQIPWRHTTNDYSFDHREPAFQRGAREIVNLIKTRKMMANGSLVKHVEAQVWNKPTDSNNTLDVFGIPYWIVKSVTQGFNGTNPAGFTAGCAGLSSTTYPQWANYTDGYTNWTPSDGISRLRRAMEYTKFVSPMPQPIPDFSRGDARILYCNWTTKDLFIQRAEQQNDRLGFDLDAAHNVLFQGHPFMSVPTLDSDTQNPVYGIQWGQFYPVALSGWWFKESTIGPGQKQHTVTTVYQDFSWNMCCRDRRSQFVLRAN